MNQFLCAKGHSKLLTSGGERPVAGAGDPGSGPLETKLNGVSLVENWSCGLYA